MEKLVETLGITRLSKSQVIEMARDLDAQVEAFWSSGRRTAGAQRGFVPCRCAVRAARYPRWRSPAPVGRAYAFLVASVPNPVFNHVAGLTAQNVGALPELAHWYGASGLPPRVDVTPAQALTARARVLQGGP